jgi:uncharacterized protein
LENGTALKITQATDYPWMGDIKLTVSPDRPSTFTVYLRWPAWAASADVQVNGQAVQSPDSKRGSFIPISRNWRPGDTVTLSLPLQNVPTVANPRSADLYGRLAIQRGPLVYALEQIDQNGIALGDIFVRSNGQSTAEPRKELLGGVTVLKVSGQAAEKSLGVEALYEPLATAINRSKRPITLTFIPYYAIANREPTPMEVWVPISRFDTGAASSSALNPSPNMPRTPNSE